MTNNLRLAAPPPAPSLLEREAGGGRSLAWGVQQTFAKALAIFH
jgi:hypothetical protein